MCTRLQSITVQCVSASVDQLANILNSFLERLISGRGKRLTLLKIVESELEKLWTDSLTFPTCHSCLINIILLMELVLKVYKVARPRSLCNSRLYIYKYETLNYTIATKNFLFLFQIIVLINGRPFTVSTERFDILRRMRASAGTSLLLPEFRPLRFPYDADIWQLLYKCFCFQGICCFLARQFVLYMAGIFQTFNAASLSP